MSKIKVWALYDMDTLELIDVFPTEDEAIVYAITSPRSIEIINYEFGEVVPKIMPDLEDDNE